MEPWPAVLGLELDVAKRAGRVRFQVGSIGFAGRGSKRVIFKMGQSGCGSNGSRVESGRESGRVDPYFSNNFFFFFFGNRCNLSIVYEFLNCD